MKKKVNENACVKIRACVIRAWRYVALENRYLPVRLSPRCCGHRKEGLGCCLLRMSPVRCGGCEPLAFQTIGDHYLPEREKVRTVREMPYSDRDRRQTRISSIENYLAVATTLPNVTNFQRTTRQAMDRNRTIVHAFDEVGSYCKPYDVFCIRKEYESVVAFRPSLSSHSMFDDSNVYFFPARLQDAYKIVCKLKAISYANRVYHF